LIKGVVKMENEIIVEREENKKKLSEVRAYLGREWKRVCILHGVSCKEAVKIRKALNWIDKLVFKYF
jgi:hypothetical protein